MRVGLNSGEVVVRAIGNDLHMDYTAVGQTTHLAARMEQLATSGDDPAHGGDAAAGRRVRPGHRRSALCPSKGLTRRSRSASWSAPVRARPLAGPAARGLTRFVGGGPELRPCARPWSVPGAGHGQVVRVVGEAGGGEVPPGL